MAREWLEREDLSVFVVAGAPKGFNRKLQELLEKETGANAESLCLKDELAEWVLARVRGDYRRDAQRSPASRALWRAFRALAAAQYHLRHDTKREGQIRTLRDKVERHWTAVAPAARTNGTE